MGCPKQLLRLDGESLVRHVAKTALGSRCDVVFVVVGAHHDAVTREIDDLAITRVENPRWPDGLCSSIRAGVEAVAATKTPSFDAVLIMLADQPAVTAALLDRLVAALDGASEGLVACEYGGIVGAPALFARRHFDALRLLAGDRGGKALLAAHADAVVRIPFAPAAIDVDTPDDFTRVTAAWPRLLRDRE